MKTLIDRDELYKALSQWDWQDLYLPVHFKEMVDELPAVDGGYTEQDVRDSYNDGFSMGVQRGYENAVLHYAKLALKQWIPCSERLPDKEKKTYWICTDTGCQGECRWTNNVYGLGESDRWEWSILDIPRYSKVVAWMPLPEPYEERREDA